VATAAPERPTVRAKVRYVRTSPPKVREVLNLIRGEQVDAAEDILRFTERGSAPVVLKALRSAVANAENNAGLVGDELYVSACYADEGPTLKRWRPRARGRATRIRKRTSHITIELSVLTPEQLARLSGQGGGGGRRSSKGAGDASRRRRVARSRGEDAPETTDEAADDGSTDTSEGDEAKPEKATAKKAKKTTKKASKKTTAKKAASSSEKAVKETAAKKSAAKKAVAKNAGKQAAEKKAPAKKTARKSTKKAAESGDADERGPAAESDDKDES